MADITDEGNALEHRGQTDIQPHVAIEDMAELVGNHTLQFVPLQMGNGAASDRDDRVGRGDPCGKSVNTPLAVHHVDRRHRHVGCQGDLLNHVQAATLAGIGCLGQDARAAHTLGHRFTAGGKLNPLDQYHQCHGGHHPQADTAK